MIKCPLSMTSREALEIALRVLDEKCSQNDSASPAGARYREAFTVIDMIVAQRGCEDFDSAGDGSLPSLIDTIVFG